LFDYTRECKFSTYARWCIEGKIRNGIAAESRTIRIPIYMNNNIRRFYNISQCIDNDTFPGDKSLKDLMALDEKSFRNLMCAINMSAECLSLDWPYERTDVTGEMISTYYLDVQDEYSVEEEFEYKDMCEQIKNVLEQLTDRERMILILRFGLFGNRPRILEECGRFFGNITKEGCRLIEAKGMYRLRRPRIRRRLEDYFTHLSYGYSRYSVAEEWKSHGLSFEYWSFADGKWKTYNHKNINQDKVKLRHRNFWKSFWAEFFERRKPLIECPLEL